MADITAEILKGQPDPAAVQQFYSALAIAISSWQRVEMMLFLVFEQTVFFYARDQRNDSRSLAAAFHGLQHFNSQLNMTDMAVRTRIHHARYMPELLPRWEQIYRKATRKYPKRNALVHFDVVIRSQEKKVNNKIAVEPLFTDERYRINLREKKSYTINDIQGMGTGFRSLANDLGHFSALLDDLSERQRVFLSL